MNSPHGTPLKYKGEILQKHPHLLFISFCYMEWQISAYIIMGRNASYEFIVDFWSYAGSSPSNF
jgi:hypothetical protein